MPKLDIGPLEPVHTDKMPTPKRSDFEGQMATRKKGTEKSSSAPFGIDGG
ncbi:hypothetical protein [Burkholderia sp. SCN-KJ]|nr:hypothetical protein [Burkholderia sp. SCN-KJ]MCR4469737.1 hypothetical protein [Burkholderia sp. SCN-KJ]